MIATAHAEAGRSHAEATVAPRLGVRDVHVWSFGLSSSAGAIDADRALLSEDEVARAARFRFARDRGRYVAGRARLRTLLARYTGRAPRALCFDYGARGKPLLADDPGLHFNLAHADDFAVVAVTRLGIVGIDVERIGAIPEALEIARHHFAPTERSRLAEIPRTDRAQPFLVCWTRKEAYVKALGDGLSHALDEFEVSLDDGARDGLLRVRGDANEAAAWTVRSWRPGERYIASVAVRAVNALIVAVRLSARPSQPSL